MESMSRVPGLGQRPGRRVRASNGERANTLMDTGLAIIVLTTRGNKSARSGRCAACGRARR